MSTVAPPRKRLRLAPPRAQRLTLPRVDRPRSRRAGADPWEAGAQALHPLEARYAKDPHAWVRERLSGHLWSKQVEIMESVRDNRNTAVRSCHGTGKSFDEAALAAWWIDTHPVGEAIVVSTAPSWKQVNAVVWRDLRKIHKKADLPGRINLEAEWYIGRDELVAFGRKPADHDQTSFQGIHAKYVLVIIDEAGGVPKALFDAVDSLATNEHARIVAAGNPDDASSYFERICRPDSGWNLITISAFDTPNFTGEPIPDYLSELLISKVWVEERKKRWGEDSSLYQSKVLGIFPNEAEDGVIPYSWIMSRCRDGEPGVAVPIELGVDVGAGGDESVIALRRGRRVSVYHRDRKPNTMRTTGEVMRAIRETGATRVKVDVIGIGKGVVDRLEELREEGAHKAEIIGVNVGGRARKPEAFVNLRSELWWRGRELAERGGWDLSELDDDDIDQLCSPKYEPTSTGKTKVEPKDEIRKRKGYSPDVADAVLLAVYDRYPPREPRRVAIDQMPDKKPARPLTADLVMGAAW